MKQRKKTLFSLVVVLISLGFVMATAWLWYDLWRDDQMKAEVKKSIYIPKGDHKPDSKPTSTAALPSTPPTSTVPTIPTSTPPRVAVSPLLGTLVLQAEDVNLDVPFTSQAPERNWAEPWQNACEEAVVLMMDAYVKGYGLSPLSAKDEILRMLAWEKERNWFTSIDSTQIGQLFTEYLGYKDNVKIIENPTVEQIKKFVDQGKPVVVLTYGKNLFNRFYRNGGPEYHAFIIRGYTKDKFITNDPGVNRGANFPFSIDVVMDSLHDWNGGNVKTGKPVIIVIE